MRFIKFLVVWVMGLIIMAKFIYPYITGAGMTSPSAPSVLFFIFVMCWSVVSLILAYVK